MAETRDWQRNREMWIRVLEKQTGEGLEDVEATGGRKPASR